MENPIRIAILFSGAGSNMKALADHIARDDVNAELVLTICNRPQAKGIALCKAENMPCTVIDHTQYEERADFDKTLDEALVAAKADLICTAGFMRILTEDFVTKWHNQIVNIHPSLLPKYKGRHTHQRALEAGESEHGCTVHLTRPALDDGPILVQKSVPVLEGDTPESLAARVLEQEHIAFPQALDMVLQNWGNVESLADDFLG